MHRLVLGDALKKRYVAKESVDLIVTSPPYNVGMPYSGAASDDAMSLRRYERFTRAWMGNCLFWARDTGRLCVNVSIDKNKHGKQPLAADITRIGLELGWQYHATIIWNEGNISRRTAWGSWRSASAPHVIAPVEVIIVFYKGAWKRQRPGPDDITAAEFKEWVFGSWSFNGESGKRVGHEAPFPRELPKRCIKLFSFVGDTVFDPFVGSGTTMIEAAANNRVAVGLEKERAYCKLTRERFQRECNLILKNSSRGGAAGPIYRAVLDRISRFDKPSQLIKEGYSIYRESFRSTSSVNGRIFELLVCEALAQSKVVPFYYQAEFALVPRVSFDVVLYEMNRPVILSLKTTLRERYRQAELEGTLLKQVYRHAESHLITLSDECVSVQHKIDSDDIYGLTSCMRGDLSCFDALVNELKNRSFGKAKPIVPLLRGRQVNGQGRWQENP